MSPPILDPIRGALLRSQPDAKLVALAREGRERAFEEIVRRYRAPLVGFAAMIVPADRADDVVQESLLRALSAIRSSDAAIQLRPWLFRIVRNRALNDLRDTPVHDELSEDVDGVPQPPEVAERREELAALLGGLRALPDAQREAIVARELEGRGHAEIAAELGTSTGAVRQLIFRARGSLRQAAGLLIPLPALRFLLGPGGAEAGAAAGAAGVAAAAGGGAAGGAGAKLAIGLAAAVLAVGGGIAVERGRDRDDGVASGAGEEDRAATEGPRAADVAARGDAANPSEVAGPGTSGPGVSSGSGRPGSGSSSSGPGGGDDSSGSGSGGSGSGSSGSDSGSSGSDSGSSGSDSGSSGSGGSGESSGPGDDDGEPEIEVEEPPETEPDGDSSGSGSSGSGSGSSGSGSDSSGSGSGSSDSSGSGDGTDDDLG